MGAVVEHLLFDLLLDPIAQFLRQGDVEIAFCPRHETSYGEVTFMGV